VQLCARVWKIVFDRGQRCRVIDTETRNKPRFEADTTSPRTKILTMV
jgi:hypothetical protein